MNKKSGHKTYNNNQYHSRENNGKKISVGKRNKNNNDDVVYFIEYKNKDVELGRTWKEIVQSIDDYFGKSDMVLNLAMKINLWEELRKNSNFNIPR